MELSEAFRFLTLLSESFKLIYKNPKPIVSIIAISLITPSITILLLLCSIQFIFRHDSWMNYMWILFVAEIVFFIALMIFSLFIRLSTILVSASSYTGNTISLTQLFPIFKSTFEMQRKTSSYISRRNLPFSIVIGIIVAVVVIYPNVTTISIAILIGVPGLIYQIYSSVVSVVAIVVSVVEQDCYAKDAVDRATVLVEGQQLDGFLMNLFLNLVILLGFGGYWMAMGDKVVENFAMFLLVMVNFLSLFQILALVSYTVFYFDCRKRRGEEIESVGIHLVQYSKLPTVQLPNDLP